jgi:transcriptional regulator with XRE-family HTH domain
MVALASTSFSAAQHRATNRPQPKKIPDPTDKHVGSRVRMRRMMLNMSQEKLGDALDLTFQQIQKYEKGTNRIGSSRLQQISNILQVPISYFFAGGPSASGAEDNAAIPAGADPLTELCTTRDGLALARAFNALVLTNPKMARAIVRIVETAAHIDNGDEP